MKKYITGVLVFVLSFSFVSNALAADTGATLPTVFADDPVNGGTVVWNNLSTLGVFQANQYATAVLDTVNTLTDYVKVSGFGFAIPAGATIDGIKVRIEKKKNCTTVCTVTDVADNTVSLMKSGALVGGNKALATAWFTSDNARYYGTPLENADGTSTDLWGTTWTPAELNNANFGVAFSATGTTDGEVTLSVDEIRVTVYYTLGVDITAPVISEVTAVTTPTNDSTPDYVFTTDEAGTITYGGSCSSATSSAVLGSNTVTFNTLVEGTYSDCTVSVTDVSSNVRNILSVPTFIIDLTAPVITLSGVTPVDISVGDTYTDAGATATDNVDLFVTINTTGSVDINTAGTYTLTYNATDTAGNVATSVTRTVNVNTVVTPPPSGGGGGGSVPLYILQAMNQNVLNSVVPKAETPAVTGKVLGEEKFIFTLFLQRGSHKIPAKVNEIRELQMFLNKNRFGSLVVDGKFGPLTEGVLIKFQLSNNLIGDGEVGDLTRAVLNR